MEYPAASNSASPAATSSADIPSPSVDIFSPEKYPKAVFCPIAQP